MSEELEQARREIKTLGEMVARIATERNGFQQRCETSEIEVLALRAQRSADMSLRVKLLELASKYGIPETDTEEGEKITDMIERLAERNTTQVATIAKLRVVRIEQDKELAALRAERDRLKSDQVCVAHSVGSREYCKCVVCTGFKELRSAHDLLIKERDTLRATIAGLQGRVLGYQQALDRVSPASASSPAETPPGTP